MLQFFLPALQVIQPTLLWGSEAVPGLVANFNLSTPAKVEINLRVRINNRGCFASNDRRTFVELVQLISGGITLVGSIPVYTPNSEIAEGVSGHFVVDFPTGNYSYKVRITTSISGTTTTYAQNDISILT